MHPRLESWVIILALEQVLKGNAKELEDTPVGVGKTTSLAIQHQTKWAALVTWLSRKERCRSREATGQPMTRPMTAAAPS